jgi:hypothetical protein
MAMTEDLTVFFDTENGFADTATLSGVAVTGIFSSGLDDPTLAGFGPVGSSPQFMLPASQVPAAPEGKPLVITSGIGAGSYRIGLAEPDGTGITLLRLTPN